MSTCLQFRTGSAHEGDFCRLLPAWVFCHATHFCHAKSMIYTLTPRFCANVFRFRTCSGAAFQCWRWGTHGKTQFCRIFSLHHFCHIIFPLSPLPPYFPLVPFVSFCQFRHFCHFGYPLVSSLSDAGCHVSLNRFREATSTFYFFLSFSHYSSAIHLPPFINFYI